MTTTQRKPYKEFDPDEARPEPINMWHFARYIELALASLRYEVDCGVDIKYPRNRKRVQVLAEKIKATALEAINILPRTAIEYTPLAESIKRISGGDNRNE